jgi:aryl-alcohol dehydrogenase-like predicted oxidoreductase/predicted kinase
MRLSTDPARDEARAEEVIRAAVAAGVTLLDTAPSYGHGEGDEHHNERLIARATQGLDVRISTKGGLVREGTLWVPDGRARSLIASCEASLTALGRSSIDLYHLHAPDPKVSFLTSVRALAQLKARGLVQTVGLSNVSLAQLEEARNELEISAIQVALGAFDEDALRSGVVRRALALGLEVHAHTPLGGPKRKKGLVRDRELVQLGEKYQTTPASIVLAWFYGLDSTLVLLPGASQVETARASARAARLVLEVEDQELLDRRFALAARAFGRSRAVIAPRVEGEVVVVMGIQGAGKSEHVRGYVERGYERLNRDERGGTLKGLAQELEKRLGEGARRVVLDNTYATRAQRSRVVEIAQAHGLDVTCVWLDTPLEAAQRNAIERLLDRHGHLPGPEELRELSRRDPNTFAPTVQHRYRRELEPPSADEGFREVVVLPFARNVPEHHTRPGLVIAYDALSKLQQKIATFEGSVLAFAWAAGASLDAGGVELRVCTHGGGPPICWCRPPLAGLVVPWLRTERIDPRKSELYGTGPQHRAMALALGMSYVEVETE